MGFETSKYEDPKQSGDGFEVTLWDLKLSFLALNLIILLFEVTLWDLKLPFCWMGGRKIKFEVTLWDLKQKA